MAKFLRSIAATPLMMLGLFAQSGDFQKWQDVGDGVAVYVEHRRNVGAFYYMVNETSEPRCATWINWQGQTPTWFRLAPLERRLLGQGVVIREAGGSADLRRC